MAIELVGSPSGTKQEVDTTPKAARVIIYDSAGNAVDPSPTGSYLANLSIRHTAADASASAVFAMTNPTGSGRTVYIRAIRGRVLFDGTAAAATTSGYELIRYGTNVNPTTGTTVGRVKKRTAYTASVIADANIQQKSGVLTLTSAVFDTSGALHTIRLPLSVTGSISELDFDLVQSNQPASYLELAPGEGLAIRLIAAAVIGLGLGGSLEWDERV